MTKFLELPTPSIKANKKYEVVKEKQLNKFWAVYIVKDGAGYSVKLIQFDKEVKTFFRFKIEDANLVFNQAIKELK